MAEVYLKRLILFLVALMLIIAGLGGNLGSMMAAILDTSAMVEGGPANSGSFSFTIPGI